jgi:hypothetical protein
MSTEDKSTQCDPVVYVTMEELEQNMNDMRTERVALLDILGKFVNTASTKMRYLEEQRNYHDSMIISHRELIVQLQTRCSNLATQVLEREVRELESETESEDDGHEEMPDFRIHSGNIYQWVQHLNIASEETKE